MKSILFFLFPFVLYCYDTSNYQSSNYLKEGTYKYKLISVEYGWKKMADVKVVILKNTIKVIYYGKGNLSAKKGEIIFEGLLLKHKSGRWILASKKEDINAKDIGGCTEIPIINPKFKTIEWC